LGAVEWVKFRRLNIRSWGEGRMRGIHEQGKRSLFKVAEVKD
jgi:hypothetical protein